MGTRKRNSAEARKEAKKTTYVAKLVDNPTSPRKTRLTADLIRLGCRKSFEYLAIQPT